MRSLTQYNIRSVSNTMCEFISWIEKPGKAGTHVYFLTYDMIFNSPRGEGLRHEIGSDKPEDFYGHAAIRKYFPVEGGINKECSDFYSPTNFPLEIVGAIKNGNLRGLANPIGLLSTAVDAKWRPEWYAVDAKVRAERDAVAAKWRAEWDAVDTKWRPEQVAVDAKWRAERDAIDAKWRAERDVVDAKFWDLFTDPQNRVLLWRG